MRAPVHREQPAPIVTDKTVTVHQHVFPLTFAGRALLGIALGIGLTIGVGMTLSVHTLIVRIIAAVLP